MTVPEPTTKRKPLTPLQRAEMFARHKGICVICKLPIIGRKWRDEHIRALGLNGTNDMSNRGPAHITCAEVKTHDEDMPRIVKAKAQSTVMVGKDPEARPAFGSKRKADKPKPDKLDMPPRRSLYAQL